MVSDLDVFMNLINGIRSPFLNLLLGKLAIRHMKQRLICTRAFIAHLGERFTTFFVNLELLLVYTDSALKAMLEEESEN